ncbi:hypothetical protein O6H91_23G011700 [Diphasiastrum complanatum]|uniref:Uncharacterized protein n=1 Tax=Diphasiastrum complanatum TaxID=34168 RepID=A0ACC2A838_DIPCM|nr:hypothetical protein O6H91_23G011700 [Diphasiastrum complanatum]
MTHQGSSLFATLGAALNAISHPHFPVRTSSLTAHPHPAVISFNGDLVARLQELKQPNDGSYLSVAWLHQAMATVLATNSAVENLLVLHQSLSNRDSKWVDEYLDDSAKLLDVCNFLKEGLADVDQYHVQVELALHAFEAKDGLSEIKCNRAKHALIDCMEVNERKDQELLQRQQKSKLETCSSMLRRMGEKLTPVAHDTQWNAFLSGLYAAKLTTIFICSLLAAALTFKPRRQFPLLHIPGQFPWSSSLLILQHKAKDEIDSGRTRQSVAHLQELDRVDAAIRKLHDFVENAMVGKLLPLGREEDDKLRNLVDNLNRSSKELEKGLGLLKPQVNEVFRMLVTSRVALLDLLSHAKD